MSKGIDTIWDERFGNVVFLGESGEGKRYERLQMARRDPAIVINDQVLDAHPMRVYLRRGEPDEHLFWVLERPRGSSDGKVLVRVCTKGVASKGGRGYWIPVAGEPNEVIKGHGAKVEMRNREPVPVSLWDDGIFVLREGDILKVAIEGRPMLWALYKLGGRVGTMPWEDLVAAAGDDDERPAATVIPLHPEPTPEEVVAEEHAAPLEGIAATVLSEEEQLAAWYAEEQSGQEATQ